MSYLNLSNLGSRSSGHDNRRLTIPIDDLLDDKPVAIGAGILVILFIALLLYSQLHSPGLAEYTITSEALSLHSGVYSDILKATDIDVGHIQIVDLRKDTHWRPTTRFVDSYSSGQYRFGYWRVEGGEKVRLYQAGGKRMVLLPIKGKTAPVLVQVKQPEAFVQELQQAWR